MSIHLREFRADDSDYEVISAIWNVVNPTAPETPSEARRHDSLMPKGGYRCRIIAEDGVGGDPVGFSFLGNSVFGFEPKRVHVDVTVLPHHRRRGIGGRLYDELLLRMDKLDLISAMTGADESCPDGVKFAESRGYVEKMREWQSFLDMKTYEPPHWEHLEQKAVDNGISVKSLRELEDAGFVDWEHKLYKLETETFKDVPWPDPMPPLPYEQLQKIVLESPNLLMDGFFIALDGDRFVGSTGLWLRQSDSNLETGLTGVLRDYRRKGIASALKLRALRWAKATGSPKVRTENATHNRAMLSINEMLGFKKEPARIIFKKEIESGSPGVGAGA